MASGMVINRVCPSALRDVRLGGWVVLPGRSRASKVTGLLVLRPQVAVLRRPHPRPRLDWAGQRGPRRADPTTTRQATDAPAGHTRHRPAMAPAPGPPEAGLPTPDGTASSQRRDRRAQTRPPPQRIHDPPGPQDPADPSGTETARRHQRARILARPRQRRRPHPAPSPLTAP